ncbi:MAG: YbaN family protein [Gammaproteobacteria bacterium]|nr:YbaN family protein [Gammaproteobacteria bacterium]
MQSSFQSPSVANLPRWLWTTAGAVLFVLGVIGIALPVMPTVVFWIGAVACFSRGHPALARPILTHPRFGPPISLFLAHGVIAPAGKRAALLAMTGSAVLIVVLSRSIALTAAALCGLALAALYVATRPAVAPSLVGEGYQSRG